MNHSRRFLLWMAGFLVGGAVLAMLLGRPLVSAFLGNPGVNGVILVILLCGIVYIFRQVLLLDPEIDWIESFRYREAGDEQVADDRPTPRLLAPMARMLGTRQGGRVSLSASSLQTLLDGIASRLAELKTGLETPLAGMSTAFSSSLFGLAGSLVLGFLDLQAGQAQNRFYNDLEEWLSSYTRLSGGGPLSEAGDASVPAYIQALLEQTADSLENLQRITGRGEESRIAANASIITLTEKLAMLGDQMKAEQNLLLRLAENQMELKPVLSRLADGASTRGQDEALRNHMRNIEMFLARLAEDLSQGRSQTIQEVRSEIRLLARTIAALAEEADRAS